MRAQGLLLLCFAVGSAAGQTSPSRPVINMHLHAFAADFYGPPPVRTCAGDLTYTATYVRVVPHWVEKLKRAVDSADASSD
jgi:hypothetical protein